MKAIKRRVSGFKIARTSEMEGGICCYVWVFFQLLRDAVFVTHYPPPPPVTVFLGSCESFGLMDKIIILIACLFDICIKKAVISNNNLVLSGGLII